MTRHLILQKDIPILQIISITRVINMRNFMNFTIDYYKTFTQQTTINFFFCNIIMIQPYRFNYFIPMQFKHKRKTYLY